MIALAAAEEAEKISPGTIGFLVVAAIGIALWFLIRSMNKQIRKIDFKNPDDTPGDDNHPPPTVTP